MASEPSSPKARKNTLLGELESIKGLLDRENRKQQVDNGYRSGPVNVDDIPVLDDIIDDEADDSGDYIVDDDISAEFHDTTPGRAHADAPGIAANISVDADMELNLDDIFSDDAGVSGPSLFAPLMPDSEPAAPDTGAGPDAVADMEDFSFSDSDVDDVEFIDDEAENETDEAPLILDELPVVEDELAPDAAPAADAAAPASPEPAVPPSPAIAPAATAAPASMAASAAAPVQPKATGENPFLPREMLARLKANAGPLHHPAPAASGSPAVDGRTPAAGPSRSHTFRTSETQLGFDTQLLLQEIINEFAPKIEAELRRRLLTKKAELLDAVLQERAQSKSRHK